MNETIASISRAREWRVVAALTILAAVLRLIHLGAQSLWVDEILTLAVATPKPGFPLGQLLLHNIHGPLHTFVVAVARELKLPVLYLGVGEKADDLIDFSAEEFATALLR